MGGQGLTQCAAPITPMQQFSLTAPGIFGYGQSGRLASKLPVLMLGCCSRPLNVAAQMMMDGQGMIGGRGYARFGATGQRLTAVQAQQGVVTYLAGYYNDPDLAVVGADGVRGELLRPGG